MEYNLKIEKKKYNLAMLKVINCFLNMTEFELEIIAAMLNNNILILNTESRKLLRDITNKGIATTNNYIKNLKDKRILLEQEEGLVINQSIIKPIEDGEVNIKFNILEPVEIAN